MLETAHSEVASRFPRNCSLSQPVSKAWKLPKNRFAAYWSEWSFRPVLSVWFRSVPFRCGGDGVLDPDFTLYLLTQLRARAPE